VTRLCNAGERVGVTQVVAPAVSLTCELDTQVGEFSTGEPGPQVGSSSRRVRR
jgi:hypothetical protein